MIISQKKTCDGCKVLDDGIGHFMNCGLGYNNRGRYDHAISMHLIEPQEPCPKPRTYAERYEAEEKYRKQDLPIRTAAGIDINNRL